MKKLIYTTLLSGCYGVLAQGDAPLTNGNWDAGFGDPGLEIAFAGIAAPAAGPSAMAVDGNGNVYLAGGNWNQLDGTLFTAPPGYAKWDRESGVWSTFGNNASTAGVFEMAVDGSGKVYVGGQWSFFIDGAALISSPGIVQWNGTTWSAVGGGLAGGAFGVPPSVEAMVIDAQGNLYVGGNFTEAGGVSVRNVAKWDGQNWSALGAGLDSRVAALAIGPDGTLYAGGVFAEGAMRRVARWDGSSWQPMSTGFTSGEVNSFAFDGQGNVYAGGTFQMISDPNSGPNFTTANRVARWDGNLWSPLGSAQNPGLNDRVRAMAFAGGFLFAGGEFTATPGAGGTPLGKVAAWDGAEWRALGTGIELINGPSQNSQPTVFHLLLSNGESGQDLIVGGPFDRAGGNVANNVALWHVGTARPITRPLLNLAQVTSTTFNLTFDSETNVTYNVLFAPALIPGFTNIATLQGTGNPLTYPIVADTPGTGFFQVQAGTTPQ